MPSSAVFALDLLAIALLTFGLYFPRHRRRDLVVSYLGVNIGVLAHMLDARVHRVAVRRVDLVNDTTNVEVRFEIRDRVAPPTDDGTPEVLPGSSPGDLTS